MTAHRYWYVQGVAAVAGHEANGMGFCGMDWLAGGVSLLPATLSANSTDGTWSLAQAVSGGTGPSIGWYAGNNGFVNDWIGFDFGAPVEPDELQFCSLNGFAWTIGTSVKVQFSDDGIARSDFIVLTGLVGADNDIQSFALTAPAVPAHAAQVAMIVVLNEASEPSSGAQLNQAVMISVGKEYPIPLHLHGWLIPAIWGQPYFIERGQMI